ncbi:hypothetical protein [Tenacibaculum finnmarkense]|nr:hypothetical protein [Tenacibaculum finnmarkense]MCD8413577.1 hypothetical protein [Tenacibaculum finnmarkense genomovar ulcerans]
MTLNIMYYLPDEYFDKLPKIYSKMNGWLGNGGYSIESGFWFNLDVNPKNKYITCYGEQSGLCFEANMKKEEWEEWKINFKKIASEILGYKVGEREILGDSEEPNI